MSKRMGGDYTYDVEYDADLKDEWKCEACGAGNSRMDGECQWCECGGFGKCKRGNCSAVEHFHQGIQLTAMRMVETRENLRRFIACRQDIAKLFKESGV